MNTLYKSFQMPKEFMDAVETIMKYCQNEDCHEDCKNCPCTLAEIRCGDNESDTEPKWIPVSERLPEEQGYYLAYIINEHDNKLQYPMTAHFSSNKVGCSPRWFPDDETASNNVVAWMPLPKPYEPQERSERMEIKEFCKKINAVPMSVIEDIKTEIKELPYQRIFGNVSSYSLLDTVIEIIDKHIERSE